MTLAFEHRFVPALSRTATPLLLLHGTGGDEDDLLPLARMLSPDAAQLSPRGQVLEHGMRRFFNRLAEGVFDPAEVRGRAIELADFVQAALKTYDLAAPFVIGFSNGANVAAVVLALRPDLLAGAILLRPMAVLDDLSGTLAGKPVLILSGASDPIVPAASVGRLAAQLRASGAEVESHALPGGHGMTRQDVDLAKSWLARQRFASTASSERTASP